MILNLQFVRVLIMALICLAFMSFAFVSLSMPFIWHITGANLFDTIPVRSKTAFAFGRVLNRFSICPKSSFLFVFGKRFIETCTSW